MSLTGCVSKAGEYLNAEDRSALFARANELRAKYVSEGLGKVEAADRAAREAVTEIRDSVRSLNQPPTEKSEPRAQISFPADLTASRSVISLLSGADRSSFIHESAHFFLEVQADLAIRIQQQISSGASVSDLERGIVSDMNALLEWFGVTGYDSASGPTGGELNQSAKQTDTEAFRRWFGDSKVVDENGDPLVVYHGTDADIKKFDPKKIGSNFGADAKGFFFTSSPVEASNYAENDTIGINKRDGANVLPAFVSLKRPLLITPEFLASEGMGGLLGRDGKEDTISFWDTYQDIALEWAAERKADGIIIVDPSFAENNGEPRRLVVAFRPEQIKSAIGNRGTFDPSDQNILNQGGPDVEAGPSPLGRTPLETWSMMSLAEKTPHHEKFAQGFEKFAMEGKAPSLTLQGAFHKFRSWLIQIYKKLTGLNVKLTDDVRDVMSRMIASDQAIEEMEAVRSLGALFKTADKAGMTLEQFNTYQEGARAATDGAIAELQSRSLKDMKWLSGARDRALKARQAEVEELRREARIEARASVYSEPVYQAWQFLTGKGDPQEVAPAFEKAKASKGLDLAKDSLLVAIAKLGGINRESAKRDLSVSAEDLKMRGSVFGSPVFRKEGGLMADDMREELTQLGYLTRFDEFGRTELRELEELVADEVGGRERFSTFRDYGSDTGSIPDVVSVGKLNTDALRELYGNGEKAKWRRLSSLRMTSEKGAHPEAVAERFGFDSADALVTALSEATPPREVIEARTDELMMEKYGDINSPEAFARAADEAVHNELRARVLASELDALQKASAPREAAGADKQGKKKTADLLSKAAKAYAQEIVSKLKVRDIRPAQYTGAEARSGRMAEKAFAKGDTAEAAKHKRNQLLSHHAAKRAMEAQDEVRRVVKYMRKFEGETKAIDPGYREQIDAMLERFDFKPVILKAIDQRKSLAAWMAEQEALGIVPDIPESVLSEANRKSYKDLTLEELSELVDSVRQIEHLGRLKNKLSLAQDKREFAALAADMIEAIQKTGTLKEIPLEDVGVAYQAEQKLKAFAAMHRKTSSLIRQMDGSDDGPLYQALGRSMNERGTMEDLMLEKATVELQRIYAPILALPGGVTGLRSKLHIKELNASLTRGGRLAFALNWGNAENRQRMLSQYSEAQVRAVLKTLSPVELEFVNSVWRYIDSFWPQVAEKEERVTGVAPKKVEAVPFVVEASDGTEVPMRGGYYPLKYDSRRSDKASQQEKAEEAKQMMAGFFSRATTKRGHTKKRTETVNRPVSLNLNVITQHVTQVVHDLAWHEWIIDANKVLGDKEVAGAIRDYYGPAVLDTLRENVKGIAGGDTVAQTVVDRALLSLRNNISRSTMGLSINTAFLQPFGLTQSMVRIGPKYVLQGAAKWAGDAYRFENSMKAIYAKSDFMRLRATTFNRELREIAGAVGGKSKTMQVVDGWLFIMMQKMQLVADVPTWLGQYQKSIDQGMDESAAVASADRAVIEAQGAGHSKDLAEVQRRHPILTQFYSYFSVTLNLVAEQTAQTDFRNPRAVAGWLGDMALLIVIPAILPALAMSFLKGDDEEDLAQKMAKAQLGYLLGMVVLGREFSGPVSGYDYTGPPAGRIVTDTYRLGQQIAQGEVDEAAVVALIRLMGDAFGLPVTQVIRSYKGWKAWDEGEAGPQAILLGPPH